MTRDKNRELDFHASLSLGVDQDPGFRLIEVPYGCREFSRREIGKGRGAGEKEAKMKAKKRSIRGIKTRKVEIKRGIKNKGSLKEKVKGN